MALLYEGELIPRARELRRNATAQENHLWYDFLRTYPVRFQRQKVIDHFIVDFYCHRAGLAIEVDGGQHYSDYGMAYDAERSAVLERYGVEVLRFTNLEVDRKFGAVCEMIGVKVEERMGSGPGSGSGRGSIPLGIDCACGRRETPSVTAVGGATSLGEGG